jgi:hypothetical protein
MQTSKIVIGKSYAIERGGKPVKFDVTAIVTRKEKSVSVSEIEGWYFDRHDQRVSGKLDPKDILGEFEAYSELVAEEEQRKAAVKAAKDAKDMMAQRLIAHLYSISGLSFDKGSDEYKRPFRTSYGGGVDIEQAAVEPLVRALEAIKESA